jgi:hypothetical protein
MAVATAIISTYPYPKGSDNTNRMQTLRGTIAISTGGTYPPGGFPLNWGAVEGVRSLPPGGLAPSSTGQPFPVDVNVKSVANPPSGFIYTWDNVLGNLHILVSDNGISAASGPLVELGGAISNAIVTDVIQFEATFARE